MPKKTKKQKLLATYHKKLRLLENKQLNISPTQIKSSVSQPSIVKTNKLKIQIDDSFSQEQQKVNQYFFSDFKKSLFLIVLILGVEVSLYFAKLIK